jgi:hypothetical protein
MLAASCHHPLLQAWRHVVEPITWTNRVVVVHADENNVRVVEPFLAQAWVRVPVAPVHHATADSDRSAGQQRGVTYGRLTPQRCRDELGLLLRAGDERFTRVGCVMVALRRVAKMLIYAGDTGVPRVSPD